MSLPWLQKDYEMLSTQDGGVRSYTSTGGYRVMYVATLVTTQVVPLSETATRMRKGQVRVSEEATARWPSFWHEQKIYMASDYISLAAEVQLLSLFSFLPETPHFDLQL